MKTIIILLSVLLSDNIQAQKLDSMFVNLYTDSLKKGTYNYINVDGLYSNGSYLPLDSTDLIFTASHGTFHGNSLWIPENLMQDKVHISIIMRKNPAIKKDLMIYIKRSDDNIPLKTNEEYLEELKKDIKKKKKKEKED